jgi:hypothetical protein
MEDVMVNGKLLRFQLSRLASQMSTCKNTGAQRDRFSYALPSGGDETKIAGVCQIIAFSETY